MGPDEASPAAQSAGSDALPSQSTQHALDLQVRTGTAVETVLECVSRLLLAFDRKERKQLSRRAEACWRTWMPQESLQWLSITWTDEQAAAVAYAIETARAAREGDERV